MPNLKRLRSTLIVSLVAAVALFTVGVNAQDGDEIVVPKDRCVEFEGIDRNSMDMDDPAVRALQQDCLYQAQQADKEPLIESTDIPDYSKPEPKPQLEKIEPVELED